MALAPNTPAAATGLTTTAAPFKTTAESYAQRDAVAGVQQRRALEVMTEGNVPPEHPLNGGNRSPIVP